MLAYRKLHQGSAYRFKVLIGGEETVQSRILDADHFVDEGHVLYFEGLGDPKQGFYFNDVWVEPDNIRITNGGRVYSFKQQTAMDSLSGSFEFVGTTGYGHISIGQHGYAIQLHPWAVTFDVQVSMNAGAYFSTAKNSLVWDTASDAWKAADWLPHEMLFAYAVYEEGDPIVGPVKIVECRFTDIGSPQTPPPYMELTGNAGYTATMNGKNLLSVSTDNPPDMPGREHETIRSAFPKLANFQFDEIGFSFAGAYKDKNDNVYAVKGRGQEPFAGAFELEDTDNVVSMYGGKLFINDRAVAQTYQSGNRLYWQGRDTRRFRLPQAGFVELSPDGTTISGAVAGRRTVGRSLKVAAKPAELNVATAGKLDIYGLIGMNPMVTDAKGNFYDVVGQSAMEDFRKIILNYMDTNLRETFVSGSLPDLTPEVRAIANDNPAANAAFYKTLQVPFLAQTLSASTMEQAKYLNGVRAAQQLKRGTANNEVYKRHSDALYRHHWMKKWGNVVDYLNDQQNTDYTANIDKVFTTLTDSIKQQMEGAVDEDKQTRLDSLLKEMDVLKQWANNKKVYWACMLYYYLTKYWLPTLQAKLKDGNLSQDVTQQVRVFSALFNILEGTGVNPAPNGKTFNQAFTETVRAFQLTVILPQYIDYGGDPEYFSEVLHSIFQQFMDTYGGSADPEIVQHLQDIQQLLGSRELTAKFVAQMGASLRVLGNNATWTKIVNTFEVDCQRVLKDVPNVLGKARLVLLGSAMAGFIMVMAAGDFKSLTGPQKVSFIAASVSVFANMLVGVTRGAIRLYALWEDIGGIWGGLKVFFGYEKFMSQLPSVSTKLSSGFAKWFARSQTEVMELNKAGNLSKIELAFGRNMNEFMSQTFGAALAIVGLVLAAIDLASTDDPLVMAMDSLMIAATSLQLIATVGNWLLAGFGVMEGAMVNMCAVLGAAGAVAAIAGIVVMIVMMCIHKDPPDPLRDFVNDQADKAKLKMSNQAAIDYFNVVPDKDGKSYSGIAIKALDKCLQFVSIGGQAKAAAITYKPDTVFSVLTDDQGVSKLFTQLPDAEQHLQTVYLSVNDAGEVCSLPLPTAPQKQTDGTYKPDELAAYQKRVRQQQWMCLCQGNADFYTGKDEQKQLMKASFTLQNMESQQYLSLNKETAVMSGQPATLDVVMERLIPEHFAYHPREWLLYTNSTDLKTVPIFSTFPSAPLQWSISPPLPESFEMVAAGADAGTIRQKKGVQAPVAQKTTYTVSVSGNVNGQTYLSSSTMTLQVEAAATQPQAMRGGLRFVPGF